MGSLGETLRQARLDKGVSLLDAERDTRIRRRFLEALENEDFTALPAPVYGRGMIRNYARYLGLSPETMVDLYQSSRPREERILIGAAVEHSPIRPAISVRSLFIAAAALVAIGLLFYGYNQYATLAESIDRVQKREAEKTQEPRPTALAVSLRTPTPASQVRAAPSATAAPPPTPTPAPTPVEGVVIEARIVAPTWLEVWVDGNKILGENVTAGTDRRFEAKQSVRMRVANGSALQVTENGVARGPLEASGRPAEARWTRG